LGMMLDRSEKVTYNMLNKTTELMALSHLLQ
jgi:hypothetical protein